MTDSDGRLYEFRIEYVSENSVGHNYHYYLAYTPKQALYFQLEMMNHKQWDIQIIKLERKCPFTNKWEDKSKHINNTTKQ